MMTDQDASKWKKTPDGIPIPPPSPGDVLYEAEDGVARITLNRPIVLNAINKNVNRLLNLAFDRAEADEDVRVVILTGAGRAFSAGGDLWSSLYPDVTAFARSRDGPRSSANATRGGVEIAHHRAWERA